MLRGRVDAEKLLRENPLFAGVGPTALREVISGSRRGAFKPGGAIFLKGQRSDHVYAVLSGQVSAGVSSRQGHVLFHRILEAGDLFGEIGVFDGGSRTASAVAQRASELLIVPRAVFLQLIERTPALASRLLALLAQRLRSTSQMLEDTLFLSARDRVGRRLLELAGDASLASDSVTLPRITQEGLASMVGLSRQHVSSQLSWMRSEGLLETGHGRIVIKDAPRLAVLCGLRPAAEASP